MAVKCLLWAEGENAAVALTAVDAMAKPDVVGEDMTVAADTGAVEMTVADVVIAPQAHTPTAPTDALAKTPSTTLNPVL